jgi:hypothetical protein
LFARLNFFSSCRDAWWIALLFIVCHFADASLASAHTRSQSFSFWRIHEGHVRVTFSVQALEATRLGLLEDSLTNTADLNAMLARHLASRIVVRVKNTPCRPVAEPQFRAAQAGYLRVEGQWQCPSDGPIELEVGAFFDAAPSHVHYARVRIDNGPPSEYLFTNQERRHEIVTATQQGSTAHGASFGAYLLLGIEHILIGVDHIAFLLALLLLCRQVREVVFLVTGFTLGHSLTLSLAVLGVVEPNVPVIEAMIGFTIALVAAENIAATTNAAARTAVMATAILAALVLVKIFSQIGLPIVTLVGLALFTLCYLPLASGQGHRLRLRPLLTVLFGLIHGFGFASVLMEIGLPTSRLIPALLGFNVGVEIGQLGIVTALGIVGMLLRRYVPKADSRLALDVASAALCALGLFWFIQRGVA